MIGSQGYKSSNKNRKGDDYYCYDEEFDEDMVSRPFSLPTVSSIDLASIRKDNPVVYLDIMTAGGRKLLDGTTTLPDLVGRLYFELRKDLVPVCVSNFVDLITGKHGVGRDGVCYHYQGNRIHRIVKNFLFQAGDLLDQRGEVSKSVYNNYSYFRDENFILRHTGPGCISSTSSKYFDSSSYLLTFKQWSIGD